jgi:transcriptional regulator with XRE-family HTH domain
MQRAKRSESQEEFEKVDTTAVDARILEVRKAKGWSQNEVERRWADKVGVNSKQGRIRKMLGSENDKSGKGEKPEKRPSVIECLRLAQVLEVRPEWLWLGEGPRDVALPERIARVAEELLREAASSKR